MHHNGYSLPQVAELQSSMRRVSFWRTPKPRRPTGLTTNVAEAWALLLRLRHDPAVPSILTDCVSLVFATKAGHAAATPPRRATARIWREIADLLCGDFNKLRNELVWMLAHTSADNLHVGGKRSRTEEWRANQLADALAKRAAANTALREAADTAVRTAGETIQHWQAGSGHLCRQQPQVPADKVRW